MHRLVGAALALVAMVSCSSSQRDATTTSTAGAKFGWKCEPDNVNSTMTLHYADGTTVMAVPASCSENGGSLGSGKYVLAAALFLAKGSTGEGEIGLAASITAPGAWPGGTMPLDSQRGDLLEPNTASLETLARGKDGALHFFISESGSVAVTAFAPTHASDVGMVRKVRFNFTGVRFKIEPLQPAAGSSGVLEEQPVDAAAAGSTVTADGDVTVLETFVQTSAASAGGSTSGGSGGGGSGGCADQGASCASTGSCGNGGQRACYCATAQTYACFHAHGCYAEAGATTTAGKLTTVTEAQLRKGCADANAQAVALGGRQCVTCP